MTARAVRAAVGAVLLRMLPLRALSDPPFALAAPALLFALLVLRAALSPVTDPDVWWIAVAGRQILATHHVPMVNGWSFVDGGHPWVMHEWLAGPFFAMGLQHLGPGFFVALGVGGAIATVALLARSTLGASRRPAAGAALLLLALTGVRECFFTPRPGYLALALALLMSELAFTRRWTLVRAFSAVLVQVVWTNFHGSFPLGIVLLAAGAAQSDEDRSARWLTVGIAASSTLVNPYGARLYALVLRYLAGGDRAMALVHANIAEFAPIWRPTAPFANPGSVGAAAVVLCLAFSALTRGRHRARVAVTALVLALTVVHVRHLALAIVVGCAMLAPELDDLLAGAGLREASEVFRRLAPVVVLPGLVVAFAVVLMGGPATVSGSLGGEALPRLAARLPVGARVYAPFGVAGRLLWVAPRGVRVLLDARNDCYSEQVLAAGYALERGTLSHAATLETLERFGVAYTLVSDGHAVGEAVSGAATWQRIATEEGWTLARRFSPR